MESADSTTELANAWFPVRKLVAKSHLPLLAVAEEMVQAIDSSVAQREH